MSGQQLKQIFANSFSSLSHCSRGLSPTESEVALSTHSPCIGCLIQPRCRLRAVRAILGLPYTSPSSILAPLLLLSLPRPHLPYPSPRHPIFYIYPRMSLCTPLYKTEIPTPHPTLLEIRSNRHKTRCQITSVQQPEVHHTLLLLSSGV